MATSKQNKANIQKNRRTLFEAECAVTNNRAKAYAARSMIEENRTLILKNYTAAFLGNRQLANQNTDDVFRNRKALLATLDPANDVQANYKESMINQATVEFLEHRSSLNSAVLSVNEKMIAVNQMLIEINDTIMKANEGIVKFNKSQIAANNKLLAGGLAMDKASPSTNATRIKNNAAKAKAVKAKAAANSKKMDAVIKDMKANRSKIEKNAAAIMSRRDEITGNASGIGKNQAKVAAMISS